MYKNQLQELAQRSCFNLPSYTCVREGPDHAPSFKAIVNFNGDTFESPNYCSTLRQAEHSAAEAALISLSSHSLAARILDETGVYKNLLQEIAQRVGSPLPQYTTHWSGLGHLPVFTGTVELAGITFTGEPAKNKKQAEKNAALAAWMSLKQLAQQDADSSSEHENSDEQEQIRIARALQKYHSKEKLVSPNQSGTSIPFQKKFSVPSPRPSSPQRPTVSASKILPLFYHKTASLSRPLPATSGSLNSFSQPLPSSQLPSPELRTKHVQRFPVVGATPFTPIRQCRNRTPYQGVAPPVTIRTAVPVFSAPPVPPPATHATQVMQPRPVPVAPPVRIRHAVPAYGARSGPREDPASMTAHSAPLGKLPDGNKEILILKNTSNTGDVDEFTAIQCLEQLEI